MYNERNIAYNFWIMSKGSKEGMDMYFPSKKDMWLFVIIWATIFVCIIPAVVNQELVGLLIGLPIAIFLGWFWCATGYTIEKEELIIRFGPFKKVIRITDISKINKTKNPFSAPALSLDRIEIVFKYDYVHISPKREREFIELLLKDNPEIQLDEKLRQILK